MRAPRECGVGARGRVRAQQVRQTRVRAREEWEGGRGDWSVRECVCAMVAAARLRAPAHAPRPRSRGGVRRARARAQHDAATAAVPPGLERWRGEVALVTGASSGIGREVAARLCAAGMNVVGAARRADGMIGLEEAHPHNFEARSLDVTDPSSVADLFASMPGKVSVLVNAAGLGKQGPLLGEEPEGSRKPGGADARTISAWKRTLETNVLGLAVVTKHATSHMRERAAQREAHSDANGEEPLPAGHVIMLGSLSGHRVPGPGNTAGMYCASKYAVRALAEGLRQEARAADLDLRVTCVSPGLVETGTLSVALDRTTRRWQRMHPLVAHARCTCSADRSAPPPRFRAHIL